jgi:2-oxoglutarate dehydrogenase E1 component
MMKQFQNNSYLFGGNAPFVEELYESYINNPQSVPQQWRDYFDAMQHVPASDGHINSRDVAHAPIVESFAQRAKDGSFIPKAGGVDADLARKQVHVQSIIAAYRFLGSRWANLDPLQRQERRPIAELEPSFYGFSESDLDTEFSAENLYFGFQKATLRDIIKALRDTYCASIGAEFMYISDPVQKRWLQERLEKSRAQANFAPEKRKRILERLTAAEGLEKYLHTRYVGQKRFSLEGGETTIAMLDSVIQRAGEQGVKEVVIGMAHRGRLNVLINTLGKTPNDLFAEFEGKSAHDLPAGDVKYHQGFASDVATPGGPVHLSLAFNPSHLEIVNPVVEGSVRARQERRQDKEGSTVIPLLIHGDAAFAGQGVVMETLNLAQTRYYGTGGTVHLVINNQIGFTTSDPRDSRSTLYCSDVVKMIEAPVLHVNGDDPDASILAMEIALDFRQTFKKDIVVDLICYRKLGHNEQDTPAVTQPLMYKKIGEHPGTRKLYADKLQTQGVIKADEADDMVKAFRKAMDEGNQAQAPVLSNVSRQYMADWAPYTGKNPAESVDTALPIAELKRLSERITDIPDTFKLHNLVEKVIADRRAMGRGELALDWGMGEHLAFASLVNNGFGIRLSGQDCGRGTFTHRHAVLHDQNRERWDSGAYIPLQNVDDKQGQFTVIDSVLSEEAVMAFEYGYTTAEPNTLVIWEGQFGDFANGAQVVIDQFITSGEVKWGRLSGLTLMLPHGYEGQGPEHSSARLERYLQLCADQNIQVCYPTTPAQIFHLLRRQMLRNTRKPLIIMTPKSMLRNKEATSSLEDLATGTFQMVIPEKDELDASKVKRVVACTGKVYYDLLLARRQAKAEGKGGDDVALIRVEQLYPFPHKALAAELKRFPNAKEVVWCQEEPKNQGAWYQIRHNLEENLSEGQKLSYAGRPASASPAVGYYAKHNEQQKDLVSQALTVK